MDEDGFTLTGIAFPVAPANLDGFTIDGFQWVELAEVVSQVRQIDLRGTNGLMTGFTGTNSGMKTMRGTNGLMTALTGTGP